MTAYEVSDLLSVPAGVAGDDVVVHGYRLVQGDSPFDDGAFRYEVTVGIEKVGTRWPRGAFWVHVYDAEGLLLARDELQVVKTSRPERRQLTGSFYAVPFVHAELLFVTRDEDGQPETEDHGWTDVPVRLVANDLGLTVGSVLCQARTDFQYDNLVLVELNALVVRDTAAAFPPGLTVDWQLHDVEGRVLAHGSADLSSRKPRAPRPLHLECRTYQHNPPAWLVLSLDSDEDLELPGPATSATHAAALLALLRQVDSKLDRLLEQR